MPRAQLTDDELEITRARFARAALDIYCDEGLEAVSFRRIGEATGSSHTLAYRYFPSKEALLVRMRIEALSDFRELILASDAPAGGAAERLFGFARAYVRFAVERREEYLLVFTTEQPPPSDYPDLLAARQSLFDLAVACVQRCIDDRLIKGDALQVAHSFWVGLHGLMTLHAANQLVHGMDFAAVLPALIERLLMPMPPTAEIAPEVHSLLRQLRDGLAPEDVS